MISFVKNFLHIISNIFLLVILVGLAGAGAYILGWQYTRGILGNDTLNFYTQLKWLAQYWPRIPWWYPLEGAGASLRQGYPLFSHWLVAGIAHFFPLTLVQAMQLWGWVSVPLTAVGVGFLARRFAKSWCVSVLAVLMYLLSPLTWVNLSEWGFYADVSAYVFVPWAILFFDRFLEKCPVLVSQRQSRWRLFAGRWDFILAVVFYGLTILAHPLVGLGIATTFGVLALVRLFTRTKTNFVFSLTPVWSVLALGLVTILLVAWWLVPFRRYSNFANRDGLTSGVRTVEMLAKNTVSLSTFLSLKEPVFPDPDLVLRNFSLPVGVWVLALLGLVLSLVRSKKALAFGVLTLFAVLLVTNAGVQFWLRQITPSFIHLFFTRRGMHMVIRVFAPILAALGAWWLAELPILILGYSLAFGYRVLLRSRLNAGLKNVLQKLRSSAGFLVGILRFGPVALTSLVIAFGVIYYWRNVPYILPPDSQPRLWRIGPNNLDPRSLWKPAFNACYDDIRVSDSYCIFEGVADRVNLSVLGELCAPSLDSGSAPAICDIQVLLQSDGQAIIDDYLQGCQDRAFQPAFLCQAVFPPLAQQLRPENWLEFRLTGDEDNFITPEVRGLLQTVERIAGEGRYDLTPMVGGLIKTSQIFTSVPRMQLYASQISPNHALWGYQAQAFFSHDIPLYNDPMILNNQAGYYGLDAVVIRAEDTKLLGRYSADHWSRLKYGNEHPFLVMANKDPTGLYDLDSRARVLVIGSAKDQAYEQIFRGANRGVLPYEEALLFEGRSNKLEDYSLEELRQFGAIWLYGYQYGHRRTGEKLLTDYISQGGKLFIETGWQYLSEDWEGDDLPEYLPSKHLGWVKLKEGGWELGGEKEADGLFNSLVRDGRSWGVSTFPVGQQQSGFTPLVTVNNNVVIARGDLGRGRVVWSGMNILAHAQEEMKINQREFKVLADLWSWLLGSQERVLGEYDYRVKYNRPDPDRVEFEVVETVPAGATLYWKENWWKDFRAYIRPSSKVVEDKPAFLDIYRSGPGMMGIILPKLAAGDQIVIEYQLSVWHYLSYFVSGLTALGLLLWLLEGLILNGQLTSKIRLPKLPLVSEVFSKFKQSIVGSDIDKDAGVR